MPPDSPNDTLSELQRRTFHDTLGRRIVDIHIWAVREGLRGADAYELFDGYCQRLVVHGTPLWRAHSAMETLHPQWSGYGIIWRRDLSTRSRQSNTPRQHGRIRVARKSLSPFDRQGARTRTQSVNAPASARGPRSTRLPSARGIPRRRCDRLCRLSVRIGRRPFAGNLGVYSFSTDQKGGFSDDDTTLVQATLPPLAMKAHADHVIASGLLGTYLGEDAGRRVHASSIMQGSVDNLRAPCFRSN
jgi:adenylate cyclase